jgi:hypothetical protein
MSYVDSARAQFKAIFGLPLDQPVHMINLLRFRDLAIYRDGDPEAGEAPITGAEAYRRTAPTPRRISDASAANSFGSARPNSC